MITADDVKRQLLQIQEQYGTIPNLEQLNRAADVSTGHERYLMLDTQRRAAQRRQQQQSSQQQAEDDAAPTAGNTWGPTGIDPVPAAMAGLDHAMMPTEGFLQGGPGAMQRGLGQRTPPPLARALKGLGRLF